MTPADAGSPTPDVGPRIDSNWSVQGIPPNIDPGDEEAIAAFRAKQEEERAAREEYLAALADAEEKLAESGFQPLSIPVQPTYGATMPVGTPGMPATMTGWDADTRIVETAAGIGFGLAVSQGTSEQGIVIGGAKFRGITYRDVTLLAACNAVDIYPRYMNAGVMVRGDLWVTVVDAITVNDAVNYNPATGQLLKGTGTAIPGARIMRGAGAGGLAIVRLAGPFA